MLSKVSNISKDKSEEGTSESSQLNSNKMINELKPTWDLL